MMAFSLITNFYFDVLKYKSSINDYYFIDYVFLIEKVSNLNSLVDIINKIEICYNKYDDFKYNLNINLLVDDFLIRLGECNECCWG